MAGFVSKQDEKYRDYALNGPILKVLFGVCMPLAIYQAMQAIFKTIDALMAAHIGSQAVSAISSLSQITLMVTAVGSALAVGGSIRVSESYGKGDYDDVRRKCATLYVSAIVIGVLIAAILIPFAVPFLKLLATPQELIDEGVGYFRVEILILSLSFFNTVYIAIERSRGHSKKLMALNIMVIIIKLVFSAVFIYVLQCGVIMIAVATMISQLTLFIVAVISMIRDTGCFKFEFKYASFKKETLLPILQLSYPVAAQKILFAAGKVIVNSMSGMYGALTVGALGISNNIGGLTTNWHSGTHDGASSLVSQNRGAGKYKRTVGVFWRLLFIDVIIGAIGYTIVSFTLPWLAEIFAKSKDSFDSGFCQMIVDIHRYEMIGYITLGIASAADAFLIGMGRAKTVMFLNLARVFIFRVPVLFFLQRFTNMGAEAVGVTMMVSNVSTGIISFIAVMPIVIKTGKMEDATEASEADSSETLTEDVPEASESDKADSNSTENDSNK
ncbi:MAG: MATE family efflux transporter [Lachnospiraceae bacterium]|nr:MATE family efflux transporter [Lachnospiraceae bacterium]